MNIFNNIGNLILNLFVMVSFISQSMTGLLIHPSIKTSSVNLSVSKSAALVNDFNDDGKLNYGETLEYTLTLINPGENNALDVSLLDVLDPNLVWDGEFSSTPLSFGQDVQTNEDLPLTVFLTAYDVDGDSLTFRIENNPIHGSLGSITNTGTQTASVQYIPSTDYVGLDQFEFQVIDENNHISNTAVIEITVTSVNDKPIADNQSLSTDEDTTFPVTLTGSDPESAAITFVVISGPQHGTLSGIAPSLTYTPILNYFGSDSFTFRTNDGDLDSELATITINVNAVNDKPTAENQNVYTDEDTTLPVTLTGSDPESAAITFAVISDPQHGTLSGTVPDLTYTPVSNYNGSDSFTFRTHDGELDSELATITISINPVNDKPIADNQSLSTNEDTPLSITLTGSDPESAVITYAVIENPQHGTLSGTAPDLTYTPVSNYNGSDSFTFRTHDGELDSELATITITVSAVNDKPNADNQSLSTDEDTPLSITLTGSDPENTVITYAVIDNPQHGTLSGTAPDLTYTPVSNYNGSDSFTFRTHDGGLDSELATITIIVNAVNDKPIADNQSLSTNEDIPLEITLTGSDIENDLLSFIVQNNPEHGILTGTAPNLTYTPTLNYYGEDSFTFIVNDGDLNSEVATITITVNAINDAPVAAADAYTGIGNTPLYVGVPLNGAVGVYVDGSILANDSDSVENTNIVYQSINTSTSNGTVSMNADGTFIYTPAVGYSGEDQFTYTICDEGFPLPAVCSEGTVTITVGTVVWYVDKEADPNGDGSLATPFQNLTALNNTTMDVDDTGDVIYLYFNAAAYQGGLQLETNQQLIGAGAALVVDGLALIAKGSTPTISNLSGNGVNLANGNAIQGIKFDAISLNALYGNNISGVVTLSDLVLEDAGAYVFDFISGTPQITVNQTINNSTGGVLRVNGVGSGSSFIFNQTIQAAGGIECTNSNNTTINFPVSVSLGSASVPVTTTSAVNLNSCQGTINFSSINLHTNSKTAVNIQNSSTVTLTSPVLQATNAVGYGVRFSDSTVTATFNSVSIRGTTTTVMETLGGYDIPVNDGNGDGVFLKNNTGSLTINGGIIENNTDDGIDIRNSQGLVLNNLTIQNNGLNGRVKTAGLKMINLSGTTNQVTNSTFNNFDQISASAIRIINNQGSADFLVKNCDFTNAPTAGSGIQAAAVQNGQLDLTVNDTSSFSNLYGAALIMTVSGTQHNSLTIENSTFQNAALNGNNGILAHAYDDTILDLTIQNNQISNVAKGSYISAIEVYGRDASVMNASISGNMVNSIPYHALTASYSQTSLASASLLSLSGNTWGSAGSAVGISSDESALEIVFENNARAEFRQNLDTVYMTGNVSPYFAEELVIRDTANVVVKMDNNSISQVNPMGYAAWGLESRGSSQVCVDFNYLSNPGLNIFSQSASGVDYDLYNDSLGSTLNVVGLSTISNFNTGILNTLGTILDTGFCPSLGASYNPVGKVAALLMPEKENQVTTNRLDLAIGTIPSGATLEITFKVQLANNIAYDLEQVENQAVVSGSNFEDVYSDDPSVAGSSDSTIFPIDLPQVVDLAINQTISSDSDPAVGDSIVWTVIVINNGPALLPLGYMTAAFSNGLQFDHLPDGCVLDGLQINCSLTNLAPQAVKEFVFESELLPGVQAINTFTSRVFTENIFDPNLVNNEVASILHVNAWVDIPVDTSIQELPVTTPNTGSSFFGEFGNDAVTLNFADLPSHNQVAVSFDLHIFRTWDGTGEDYDPPFDLVNFDEKFTSFGPDFWRLSVNDELRLLETTFSNWPTKSQSYPNWFGAGIHPPKTGADAVNTLGYDPRRGGDSTYHLSYLILHNEDDISFTLSAEGLESLTNESWGFSNFQLRVTNLEGGTVFYLPLIQK
ncbi:MAG: hypothetical protein CL609_06190 [Anaerolineaceae bacterium]|nr:hypothetical protein [Anaerolineaceae bacterium]